MIYNQLKEDLRLAQENIWCKAFDADYKRKQDGKALTLLITLEMLAQSAYQLNKVK